MNTFIIDNSFDKTFELVAQYVLKNIDSVESFDMSKQIYEKAVYIRELLSCAKNEWEKIKKTC